MALAPIDISATFRGGNPYPVLAEYRRHDPVHVVTDSNSGQREIYLFRHADCLQVLRDPRLGVEWRRLEQEMWGEALADATPQTFGEMAALFCSSAILPLTRGFAASPTWPSLLARSPGSDPTSSVSRLPWRRGCATETNRLT